MGNCLSRILTSTAMYVAVTSGNDECFHDAGCDFGYRCEDDICQPIGHLQRRRLAPPQSPLSRLSTTPSTTPSIQSSATGTTMSGYPSPDRTLSPFETPPPPTPNLPSTPPPTRASTSFTPIPPKRVSPSAVSSQEISPLPSSLHGPSPQPSKQSSSQQPSSQRRSPTPLAPPLTSSKTSSTIAPTEYSDAAPPSDADLDEVNSLARHQTGTDSASNSDSSTAATKVTSEQIARAPPYLRRWKGQERTPRTI